MPVLLPLLKPSPSSGVMTREAGEKQDRLKKKHLLQVLSPGLGLRLREEPGAALDLKSKGPKGETGAVTTVV